MSSMRKIQSTIARECEPLELNDLPAHTPWVSRLMGLVPFSVREKSPENVTDEFNNDKWGALLKFLQENPDAGIKELEKFEMADSSRAPFVFNDKLYTAPRFFLNQIQKDLILHFLSRYESGPLVEWGAGYGGQFFALLESGHFQNQTAVALEYTEAGRRLIELLAERKGRQMEAGSCDFFSCMPPETVIPEDAVFFTSYSIHYVPKYTDSIVKLFSQYKPKLVVHFEPIREHFGDGNMLEMLGGQYMDFNSYSQNFLTILKESETRGKIEIVTEEPRVFGQNPLLPFSVIAWRPKY
jgi:hypothetical protein